jgi:hypothetical protein
MRDYAAINQRLSDLKRALAVLEEAKGGEAETRARDALRAVVDTKFELKQPELQPVVAAKLWPYEKRAKDRLGEPGK